MKTLENTQALMHFTAQRYEQLLLIGNAVAAAWTSEPLGHCLAMNRDYCLALRSANIEAHLVCGSFVYAFTESDKWAYEYSVAKSDYGHAWVIVIDIDKSRWICDCTCATWSLAYGEISDPDNAVLPPEILIAPAQSQKDVTNGQRYLDHGQFFYDPQPIPSSLVLECAMQHKTLTHKST
jgi:hypothetical protein